MATRSNLSRFDPSRLTTGLVVAAALTLLPAFAGYQSAGANAEGQDVFIWVKPPASISGQDGDRDQLSYNRIAFNYATTTDARE